MAVTDTLKSTETMREAGVPDQQAEGIARALDDACGEVVARLATREDLAALETRMTRTLYAVAGALLAAQVAGVFTLLRLLASGP